MNFSDRMREATQAQQALRIADALRRSAESGRRREVDETLRIASQLATVLRHRRPPFRTDLVLSKTTFSHAPQEVEVRKWWGGSHTEMRYAGRKKVGVVAVNAW